MYLHMYIFQIFIKKSCNVIVSWKVGHFEKIFTIPDDEMNR